MHVFVYINIYTYIIFLQYCGKFIKNLLKMGGGSDFDIENILV